VFASSTTNVMSQIGSCISADVITLPSPVSPLMRPVRPEAEACPKIYHTSHMNHCAVYEISPKQDICVKVRGITIKR
jgi:hypothetical protein